MPNGGSDHCGNCRHNRVNIGRVSTLDERNQPAYCTVRNATIGASFWTYCANHYVDDNKPIGPMFVTHDEHDRIPYHGESRPRSCTASTCKVCGAPSKENEGVDVTDEKLGALQFCGGRHYVRWWRQAHPGVPLKWDVDAPPPARSGNRAHDDAQAKLELADAYLAMGDRDGARDVLGDVLRIGSGAQQSRAREMLKRC